MYSLDTYISTENSDIIKFNKYYKINYESLTERGGRCDDMMTNLLTEHLTVGDKKIGYTKHQKEKNDDGEDIGKDKLLIIALKMYENICTK